MRQPLCKVRDNAWVYTQNRSLRELLAAGEIKYLRTRSYRPQTNGKVKRYLPSLCTACGEDLRSPAQADPHEVIDLDAQGVPRGSPG